MTTNQFIAPYSKACIQQSTVQSFFFYSKKLSQMHFGHFRENLIRIVYIVVLSHM